jgi:hypothetical protein
VTFSDTVADLNFKETFQFAPLAFFFSVLVLIAELGGYLGLLLLGASCLDLYSRMGEIIN